MANALTHIDSPELNFRKDGVDHRWVNARRFMMNSSANEEAVLTALIADDWYDDGFDAPTMAVPHPGENIHGPYGLDAIDPQSFIRTDRRAAINMLEDWARKYDGLSARFLKEFDDFIEVILPAGWVIYELSPLDKDARSGAWWVGMDGFLEFVAISDDHSRVNFLIASDD